MLYAQEVRLEDSMLAWRGKGRGGRDRQTDGGAEGAGGRERGSEGERERGKEGRREGWKEGGII